MSRKKPGWTEPGPVVDRDALRAAEARKGTAAANPVLSLAPAPPQAVEWRHAGPSGFAGSGASQQPAVRRHEAPDGSAASGASVRAAASAASPAPAKDGSGDAKDTRSPAEIEADIEQARQRLADTLDELTERLSPRAVLRRGNSVVRGAFVAEDGSVRKDRAALAVGAVLSAIGGAVALRKLAR